MTALNWYVKISNESGDSYTTTVEQALAEIADLLDTTAEKWTIQSIQMTEEELDALPEFEGW